MLEQLRATRKLRDELDDEIKRLNAKIILLSDTDADAAKSDTFEDAEGNTWRAAVVRKSSFEVDLEQLREVNEDVYIDVTKRVLDRSAFENATYKNLIDDELIKKIVQFKPQTPYIMFRKVGTSDE
jgi:hypothetical protein